MRSALAEFERSLVVASRQLTELTPAEPAEAVSGRRSHRTARPRRWMGTRRNRLSVALVALALAAGGVAAAHSLIWPAQRLAAGTVNCFWGTSGTGMSSPTFGSGGSATGSSPIAFCRRTFAENAPPRLKRGNVPWVACRQNASTVAVYFSSGSPDQCERLGERPLPNGYPAAVLRLRALDLALAFDQRRHDCVAPAALGAETRVTLTASGFGDWRVALPPTHLTGRARLFAPPAGTGGTCGQFVPGTPAAPVWLDSKHQTVRIVTGPPQSVARLVNHLSYELHTRTYLHCFTATSVRALVRQAFAASGLGTRFATNAVPPGTRFEPKSQALYDRGCVRFAVASPSNSNRYVDVALWSRGAPRLPNDRFYPPASAFRP